MASPSPVPPNSFVVEESAWEKYSKIDWNFFEAVRAATDSADDRVTLSAEGFGEALPMACEDTDWGRAVNRRVEVWVE